nr:LLM class flavin-dependent oxidoreductase [Rhodococcus sp. LB1]
MPVQAAKMAATIDHISGGRFALNIVTGFDAGLNDLFGNGPQMSHDERYEYAAEWLQLVLRIWPDDEEFSFSGRCFNVKNVRSQPKPLQKPRPPLMSAGSSPAGRNFAAQNADVNFAILKDFRYAAGTVAKSKAEGLKLAGKEPAIHIHGYVVCADIQGEAEERFRYTTKAMQDTIGTTAVLDSMLEGSQSLPEAERRHMMDGMAAGAFAVPFVGTPEHIVERMKYLSDAGLDGIAMSFDDYDANLKEYDSRVRPLLIQAGLRES